MHKVRVLLVDDTEGVRLLVRLLLEGVEGVEVVGEAKNGKEGVDKTRELRPDVVILDIAMPVMDGLEALKEIRRRNRDVRIIMYSGFGSDWARKGCMRSGADKYIEKGADMRHLIAAIRDLAPQPPT